MRKRDIASKSGFFKSFFFNFLIRDFCSPRRKKYPKKVILFFQTNINFYMFRIRCRIRRMRVDGSRIRKKKLRIRKYPDTCGQGLN